MGQTGPSARTCPPSWLGRLTCSRCIWRGLLIGVFALFIATVLNLTGDTTAGATDQPVSPAIFALLAAGFMAFAVAGPALIEKMVDRE